MINLGGYKGPVLPSSLAVSMTAAASGSSGITIPDNANLDMGTNDFTIVWRGALPDWTPANLTRFFYKYQNVANRVSFSVSTGGPLYIYAESSTSAIIDANSAAATGLQDGSFAEIAVSVVRETASTAGSATFYVNGAQLGSAVSISAAATVDISNSGAVNICITGTTAVSRAASTTLDVKLYNRALSAADILALYRTGAVAAADVGANQTLLTSGTLTVGLRYRINAFVAGDDFTNVGAASNATGVEFVATGTTPTTWTNSTSIRRIGNVLHLPPESIATTSGLGWNDASGNGLNATLPAAGATKVTVRR